MNIVTKHPSKCTEEEIQEFVSLVNEGGEVDSAGLSGRVKNAETLIFVRETKLIGIGSVKYPNENYKNRVFLKAGHEKEASNFELEIGYFYINSSFRGKGLSSKIMKEINNSLNGKNCFATTRTNHEVMLHILAKHGFHKLGEEYQSDNGDYKLVLYTNVAY